MATATYQPTDKDNHLASDSASTNWGNSIVSYIQDYINAKKRAILYFDASDIASAELVDSATLKIYYTSWNINNPNGLTVWAYKLTRNDWVELESTWLIYKTSNNWTAGGGDYATSNPAGDSITMPAATGVWLEFNVKAIVEDAITNVSGHVNILLKFDDETVASGSRHQVAAYSKEEITETALRPILEVVYSDIYKTDTLSLSDTEKEEFGLKVSDSLSLSEGVVKQNMSLKVEDTITITDKILQAWRRLAKHIASYVYLSRGLSEDTKDARIAHWEMNDDLDTNVVIDSEGNHNGAMNNNENNYTSEQHVAGHVGTGAFDLDGSNDYVEIPDHADFSFGNGSSDSPFSLSAWIYMDSAVNFRIMAKWALNNYEWFFTTDGSGKLVIRIAKFDNSAYKTRYYNTALSAGKWYFVVATYSGVGGTSAEDGLKVYIDGVRKDNTTGSSGTYSAMDGGTAPVHIGKRVSTYSNGKIDEAMIFNKELSQTDVTALYKLGASTYTKETKHTSIWSFITKNK